MKRTTLISLIISTGILFTAGFYILKQTSQAAVSDNSGFNSQRAYRDVIQQVNFGPRTPGSQAHKDTIQYIQNELETVGWKVEVQSTEFSGQPIQNIIAKRGSGKQWIILGAHYDSRFFADNDPDPNNHSEPVPGANDGASGVAVLLELGRTLPINKDNTIWLVFFDAEDQGRIKGWDWILGSQAFVNSLEGFPDAVVIVDMIGDADLNIFMERSSDPGLTREIWSVAKNEGYEKHFIPEFKYNIIDDHTPFLKKSIRAIDIIDFDYPYWHTISDTTDKVSAESLEVVGRTLYQWLTKP